MFYFLLIFSLLCVELVVNHFFLSRSVLFFIVYKFACELMRKDECAAAGFIKYRGTLITYRLLINDKINE